MPRDGEVAVDCSKLRDLVLNGCRIETDAALSKKLEDAGLPVTRSAIRRMLGRSSSAPYANVHIQNVENLLRLARRILEPTKAPLSLDDFRWDGAGKSELADPGRRTFEALRLNSIVAHRRAMADRHSAFALYGQALCPLASGSDLVIERGRYVTALDEAATITAPVRVADAAETFIRPAPIMVLGQEGVGKTWAVAQWWLKRCSEDLVLFLPGPDFRGVETNVTPIMEEALAKLIEPSRSDGVGEDWRRRVATDEFAAAAQGRVVIVVDGLNEAPDANWQIAIEAVWRTAIRWGARLILTSRPIFWEQRAREIAHWDWPEPVEVKVEGFDQDELRRACAMADLELDKIPDHLHEGLRNPRIFRLAIRLLPELRSANELSIDRLLDAYWRQRLRDRPELSRLDPDQVMLLNGLADHAREFHERRVQAAREEQRDLTANEVSYDLDALLRRFPGLERYCRLDGETASLLIGEIREGRFFDVDPRTPSETYLFRSESLAFALGLFLIEELKRLRRDRLGPSHMRERLDSLLEPVLDFDQTADQVMAALTIVCRDGEQLFAGLLLDQFLVLRNRPYRMKAILCGLAVQAPSVFCAGAERALDVKKAEKINPWLIAALSEMIGAGAGLATCSEWIVSPTECETGLFDDAFPPTPSEARAMERETLAAMLLTGRKIAPFAKALQQWAQLVTARRPFGRAGFAESPIARTPIALLIRFNDQDPEALTSAVLALAPRPTEFQGNFAAVPIALLLALIADPNTLTRAEALYPSIATLTDPPEQEPALDWQRAADPDVDIAALRGLLSDLKELDDPANKDPYHPKREARRALAARCDCRLFFEMLDVDLLNLLYDTPSDEVSANVWAQHLSWLAHDSASAIALLCTDDLDRLDVMLRVATGRRSGHGRKTPDELEQVLETALAMVPDRPGRLLLSLPPDALQRNLLDGPARQVWRPRMTAATGRRGSGYGLPRAHLFRPERGCSRVAGAASDDRLRVRSHADRGHLFSLR